MEEVTPHAGGEEARPPSVREVELLALVARGMSNREIAEALVLAESTVKRHLANAYQKLGVHSRSGAVDAALLGVVLLGGGVGRSVLSEVPLRSAGGRLRDDRGASPVRPGRVEAPGVPRQGDGAGLRCAMVGDGGVYPPTRGE